MKKYVVGLGEALWDMLPEGKKIGGAPANFAYHVSQNGLDGIAVSAIGNDDLGNELLDKYHAAGLNTQIAYVDYPTGTVQVSLDAKGAPQYEIKEGVAWDNIPFTPEIENIARNSAAVCFGSLAQRNSVSRKTITSFLSAMPQDENTLKIFDINLRQHFYDKETITASLNLCNVLKINDEELEIVAPMLGYDTKDVKATCRRILNDYNLKMLILTCGTDGSYVLDAEEDSFLPTPKVDVADTVGGRRFLHRSIHLQHTEGTLPPRRARHRRENVGFRLHPAGGNAQSPGRIPGLIIADSFNSHYSLNSHNRLIRLDS